MKSLEIVNKLLEKINQYDDWFLTEFEAEQIKADLEVLEIIKNKKVDVDIIWILMKKHKDINDILWYYNFLCLREYRYLTLEELLKIKQWLEDKR